MPRDMFGDVVDPSVKVGSQKWYTVPLSIAAHVFIFGAIIIIPLMATDVLPTPPSMMAFVAAAPPPPPPPPPPPAPAVAQPKVVPQVTNPNAAPVEAPKEIKPEVIVPSVGSGTQGVVIIEATIGPDGRVKEAKVLRSIPLLDQAALDAVKQWQFTPTLLNGVPVPVIMTVTVNFTLQ